MPLSSIACARGVCAINEKLQHIFARHLSGVSQLASCEGVFSPDIDEIITVTR